MPTNNWPFKTKLKAPVFLSTRACIFHLKSPLFLMRWEYAVFCSPQFITFLLKVRLAGVDALAINGTRVNSESEGKQKA